jgi:hypothetical protein
MSQSTHLAGGRVGFPDRELSVIDGQRGRTAAEGRRVGKWREAFDHGRPSFWDIELGLEYTFGPPATEEQIARAEGELGVRLPSDLRELVAEFNGVWVTTEDGRERGDTPDIAYLDVGFMAVEVPWYFRTCGNPLPAESDLRKAVFFYQENGLAELYGVCVEEVAGLQAGEVVKLDHEMGVLEPAFPSLLEFVRSGGKD